MEYPYRMAAIDLDGTLLGPDKTIHPDNLDAVRWLQSRGVDVVLASGRSYHNMLRFQRQLGLTGPMVACQGGDVREPRETLYQAFLPAALATDVIHCARQRGMTVIAYAPQGPMVENRDDFVELYETRAGARALWQYDLTQVRGQGFFKLILSQEPDRVRRAEKFVRARYGCDVQTVTTAAEALEVLPPGVHKARGMALLTQRRGLSPERVLAFGDGDNDVELLRWAGLGVAMSESTPAARAAARLQAPGGDAATSLARAVAQLETWRH